MEDLQKEVLNRIKKMLKERRMTQNDLAQKLGVEQYKVSRLLSGKPFPSLNMLLKISQILKCSIYYLLAIREQSEKELSKKSIKLIEAYNKSDKKIKLVIDRILQIDNK